MRSDSTNGSIKSEKPQRAYQIKTAGDEPAVSEISNQDANHTAAVIHCCSFCFGAAPT